MGDTHHKTASVHFLICISFVNQCDSLFCFYFLIPSFGDGLAVLPPRKLTVSPNSNCHLPSLTHLRAKAEEYKYWKCGVGPLQLLGHSHLLPL